MFLFMFNYQVIGMKALNFVLKRRRLQSSRTFILQSTIIITFYNGVRQTSVNQSFPR